MDEKGHKNHSLRLFLCVQVTTEFFYHRICFIINFLYQNFFIIEFLLWYPGSWGEGLGVRWARGRGIRGQGLI